MPQQPLREHISATVSHALAEDIGTGDITAALIPAEAMAQATVRVREPAVVCGTAWFDEVFRQVEPRIKVDWHFDDGTDVVENDIVCTLHGPARGILTGERSALNFLQTLSGTATAVRRHVATVAGTGTRLLDTRKTLPGLRRAQKYATRCGGATNHRQGLFDAVLIKENHIAAAGSITAAVQQARVTAGAVMIEVEVENLGELREALATDATRIMLDNFGLEDMRRAVALRNAEGPRTHELEASGDMQLDNLRSVAETGVDFISIGSLTKHVRAIDYSMRFSAAGKDTRDTPRSP